MRLRALIVTALVAPLLVLLAGSASATTVTLTVTGTDDPSPTPACAGTVCPSLRAAVDAANQTQDATIQLGSGTYQLAGTKLVLTASMTIAGAGAASTTIEQTGSDSLIYTSYSSQSVAIEDLTLTGGRVVDQHPTPDVAAGGAIDSRGSLSLVRVVVSGNSTTGATDTTPAAGAGTPGSTIFGGTIVSQGSLTLISSTVRDNTARAGAGGPGEPGGIGGKVAGTVLVIGSASIIDSTFANNLVVGGSGAPAETPTGTGGAGNDAFGGALSADGGATTVTVRSSTFVGNQVVGGAGGSSPDGQGGSGGSAVGGAIFSGGATVDVVNSTFSQNSVIAGAGGTVDPGGSGTAGSDGTALGGAVFDYAWVPSGGVPLVLTLASDTFAENAALGSATSAGGTLELQGPVPAVISDSIIEGGRSSGSGSNCDIAAESAVTDMSHNLEDTTPSQCGFQASAGDLIGSGAALGPLASNGGPTQTMLPSASSTVIGAGGTCTDPTANPASPLTVDQRGAPRPSGRPCDIGAVQLPVPVNTVAPSITPTGPVPGQTATCNHGTFLGGEPLSYGYAWTRDGAPLPPSTPTYPITSDDLGHLLRCTVVAHGTDYDSAPVTSSPQLVTPPAPELSAVRQSHALWRLPNSPASTVPLGTTFRFRLSQPSTVTLTFTQIIPRRRVNGRCVALTPTNQSRPVCTSLLVLRGHIVRSRQSGAVAVAFSGRLSTGRFLRPGRYIVTFSAKNAGGKVSRAVRLRFRISG